MYRIGPLSDSVSVPTEGLRAVQFAPAVDLAEVEESGRDPSCAYMDASAVRSGPSAVIAAVQRGLRNAVREPRRRVALVLSFSSWLQLQRHVASAVHELHVFYPRQEAASDPQRWIQFGVEPLLDLRAFLDELPAELRGARRLLALRRAARLVRSAPNLDEKARATALGQVLLAARTAGLSPQTRAPLEREVKALFGPVLARNAPADVATRAVAIEVVAFLVTRGGGRPPPEGKLVPWVAWLMLALVRYRAGQRRFLDRHARAVFTEGDIGEPNATDDRVIADGVIRDRARGVFVGMVTSASTEDGSGEHGVLDRRWIQLDAFAQFIARTVGSSHVSARLYRWLPGVAALAAFTARTMAAFGAELIVSGRDNTQWLALPPDVEMVVASAATDETDFFAPDDFYDPTVIDVVCADHELIDNVPDELVAWIGSAHEHLVLGMIDAGDRGICGALPRLYRGKELTKRFDRLIAARGYDVLVISDVARVISHERTGDVPEAFFRIVDELDANADPETFELVLPLLVRQRITPDLVATKLRRLCGLAGAGASWRDAPPESNVLALVLALDPEAGRALARAYLVNYDERTVFRGAITLAAIGAPWALSLLREARSVAQHPWILDRELDLAAGRATATQVDELDALEEVREYMANEVGKDLRAALFSGTPATFD